MSGVYREVTNRIIEELEEGTIPWEQPWVGGSEFAFNRFTKKTYSILNQFLLNRPGEYASLKQWNKLGGHVKKGEKGNIVVFWKLIKKEVEDEDGEVTIKQIPMLRYFYVFHISQVEGVEPLNKEEYPDVFVPVESADEIIEDYVNREGIEFEFEDGNRSCYFPATDKIIIPTQKQFKDTNEYYSTVFHELIHSTGNKSRLGRLKDGEVAAFGNETYSKEELVAEIGSATIMNMLGLETKKSFRNTTAYIQSWLNVLRNDSKFIVSASSKANKAVEYLLGKKKKEEIEKEIEEDGEESSKGVKKTRKARAKKN